RRQARQQRRRPRRAVFDAGIRTWLHSGWILPAPPMPSQTRQPSPVPHPARFPFKLLLACTVLLGACAQQQPLLGGASAGAGPGPRAAVAAPAAATAPRATAGAADVFERTLPNGMKVLVREDRRAPTVVHMVLY